MKTIKIGDRVRTLVSGLDIKTVAKILWRPHGRGDIYSEKIEILDPAKDWCIILYRDGTWTEGSLVITIP